VLGIVRGRAPGHRLWAVSHSGCWALFVGGCELSVVGSGARSRAVHIRGWGCCSWEGCSWVLACCLWAWWCRVVCRVVTVSEIGWDEGGTHLINNINKNDERQHHCRSSFVSTSLSATWHLEPPSFCHVDVAGARSLGDVALSCCGSRGRGRRMWVAA
jgi:hypothetical protein